MTSLSFTIRIPALVPMFLHSLSLFSQTTWNGSANTVLMGKESHF